MPLTHIPPQPTSEGLDLYADVDGNVWARSPVTGHGQMLGEGDPVLGGGRTEYGIGLTKTGRVVNLDPARPLPGEIGGINEPVPDDLIIYGRRYTTAGVASWVEVKASGITISDTPPVNPIHEDLWWDSDDGNTFIYYNDGTSAQWVQTAPGTGGGRDLPLFFGVGLTRTGLTVDLDPATDLLLGGITEPTPDGLVYARKWDATLATPAWVWAPTSAGLIISDTPPMTPAPTQGALWWESDTGNTFVWYEDGTSSQWVQIAPGSTEERELPLIFNIGLTRRAGVIIDLDPATNLALGGITEPIPDGLAYSRQWDNVTDPVNPKWVWVPALTAGLQITSIIPDKAIYGPGEPLLTVHAYGAEFTPTTVAVLDGRDIATTILSTTELTFVLNPQVPISEQFHIITVRDPAVPEVGLGAEQFDFIKASTEVDYGRGLSLDTLPTPPIVNLDPAGPTNMGGVIVPIRDGRTTGLVIDMGNVALGDPATGHLTAPPATHMLLGTVKVPERTAGQGLTLEDDGGLYLRIATPDHLGGFTEPRETGREFARRRDATTGLGEWVEVTGGMEEPPMDPVALWGRSNGGDRGWLPIPEPEPGMEEPPMDPVQTWGRSSGGARGWLPIPEQVGMEEPPMEPVQTWGRSSGGVRGWLPIPATKIEAGRGLTFSDDETTLHLDVATAIDLGGVFVPFQQGLELSPVGELQLARATPDIIGGLLDAPRDDTGQKTFVRKWGQWVEAEAGMEEPPMDPVALWGRSNGGDRGWLPIPEPPPGMEEPPMEPVQTWGRSSGGVRGWLPIPEAILDSMEEPPMEPVQTWGRSSGGARGWLAIPETTIDAGRGLTLSDDGKIIHLDVATQTTLGGVMIAPQPGLSIDQSGNLTLARATPEDIGGLKDAPRDDTGQKQYARKWGEWVEVSVSDTGGMEEPPMDPPAIWGRSSGGARGWIELPHVSPIDYRVGLTTTYDAAIDTLYIDLHPANKDGEIGGVKVVGRGPTQGLEYDPASGSLWAPLATELLAGSIVEPPADGLQYARSNDVMNGVRWVPTTSGGVVIGDVPPATPVPGGLWWDSDSGNTYLWYTDVDSSQWVQVASSSTGIEEAPVNNTPHVRQNAMWLPTALTTTAGDVKSGFQTVDHGGWILLDGRAVSTLTMTQQDQAALLGFTANLPNAALCGLRQDSAAAPGVVGGSAKITVANLPAHNMTSGGHDAGAVTTSGYDPGAVTTSNALGFSDLVGVGPQTGKIAAGGTGQYYIRADSYSTRDYNHSHTVDLPNHTHTVDMPNHTHTVALGGSGTDYYAKAMVVNFFVFLGA